MNSFAVSIVMPCLNEIDALPYAIAMAKKAADLLTSEGLQTEIVIADNGSTDGSIEFAKSMSCRVVHCELKGYGNALKCGISHAKGEYIIMGDADGSYDFEEAVPMVQLLQQGFDICMGSRFKGEIKPGAMPFKNKWLGNPALTGILNLFFHSGFSDAHCGLRAFTQKAFSQMQLKTTGMEFASEMVIQSALLHLKSCEIPVTLHPDKRKRPPHLRPWADGWRHLNFMLMYSPLWLFFIPATVMICFGLLISITLLASDPTDALHIGPIWYGDHWMIVAGGAMDVGYQTAIFGLVAMTLHVQQDTLTISSVSKRIMRFLTPGKVAFWSFFLIILGFSFLLYTLLQWIPAVIAESKFLLIRPMVFGTTLGVMGLQGLFSCFIFSLISQRDKQHEK